MITLNLCRAQPLNVNIMSITHTTKSVRFTFASFDSSRFWTTLITQIYARKTHADT